MNSCPTPHNLALCAPISLSLVVLHPAICTFLCDFSHLLFPHFYLPFPLCFHTLFSSIFSPLCLITSKTGLFILLSSKALLLCLSCLPDLHEGAICCLCCFLSHMQDMFLKKTEKIWPCPAVLSPKQLAATAAQAMARQELLCLCSEEPAHRRPTASFQLSKCEVPMITDHLGCLSSQNQVTRSQILSSQRH